MDHFGLFARAVYDAMTSTRSRKRQQVTGASTGEVRYPIPSARSPGGRPSRDTTRSRYDRDCTVPRTFREARTREVGKPYPTFSPPRAGLRSASGAKHSYRRTSHTMERVSVMVRTTSLSVLSRLTKGAMHLGLICHCPPDLRRLTKNWRWRDGLRHDNETRKIPTRR